MRTLHSPLRSKEGRRGTSVRVDSGAGAAAAGGVGRRWGWGEGEGEHPRSQTHFLPCTAAFVLFFSFLPGTQLPSPPLLHCHTRARTSIHLRSDSDHHRHLHCPLTHSFLRLLGGHWHCLLGFSPCQGQPPSRPEPPIRLLNNNKKVEIEELFVVSWLLHPLCATLPGDFFFALICCTNSFLFSPFFHRRSSLHSCRRRSLFMVDLLSSLEETERGRRYFSPLLLFFRSL